MKLYNTLTRKKEEFIPIEEKKVKIYACGPTVYNYIHIGNARPICVFDILRRYMEYMGYDVTFVQNFTDIDDKIINRAIEEKKDYLSVSQKYINEYKKDAKGLNIREATVHPKATENVGNIIEMISSLIDKGFAYCSENGDVYFKMSSFKEYGKLSHQPLDDLESGARIKIGEMKESPLDFVMWKSAKPGEPMWDSPWGKGRPGWHIECSAMVKRYLGETIDIHCGGQDLIFPHHENEIAQSECCNGTLFSRYWLHNGYINVDSRKMSKSLNNFFTVRDVAERYGYEPIRYLMISSHYRSPINYNEEIIEQCKSSLERLYNCRDNLDFIVDKLNDEFDKELIRCNDYRDRFIISMSDDLNTADALSVLFDLVREINTKLTNSIEFSKSSIKQTIDLFDEMTNVLGILYNRESVLPKNQEIDGLIELRRKARENKNWSEADKIRNELLERNVIVEDTPQGVKWSFKK